VGGPPEIASKMGMAIDAGGLMAGGAHSWESRWAVSPVYGITERPLRGSWRVGEVGGRRYELGNLRY